MSCKEKMAIEMFRNGFNCSQSVFGAFCGDYGIEKQTGIKISCGFGSGLRSADICGAVSGAVMIIGLKYGENTSLCNSKTEEFIKIFKEKNENTVCRDILGCDITTPDGKAKALENNLFTTTCADMVKSAVTILETLEY